MWSYVVGGALRATFEILCQRPKDEEACARALALFSDCRIREGKAGDTFDYACETRKYSTMREATDRLRDALARAGDDVIDIELSVRY